MAIADCIENQPVLVTQYLLLLLVGDSLRTRFSIGGRAFTNAAATHEDLRLQQQFALTRFALHVVDRVLVLDVSIEAENHALVWFQCPRKRIITHDYGSYR